MSISEKLYNDIKRFLRENWYKRRGLFVLLILTQAFWLYIHPWLITNYPWLISNSFFVVSLPIFYLAVVIFLFLIILGFWLYSRSRPYFGENEFGILFALPIRSDRTREELEKLYQQIRIRIGGLNLKKKVVVKKLPPNHIPIYDNDAYKTRDLTGAKLIIWGDVVNGYYLKEEAIFIAPIRFSYQIQLPKDSSYQLNENFSALLQEKKWIIRRFNDILDVPYVAQNIGLVSLYVIGLILHFSNQSQDAIELLGKAFSELDYKKTHSGLSKNEKIAYERIKYITLVNYNNRIKNLDVGFKDRDNKEKISEGYKILSDIRRIDKNNPGAYIFEGLIKFLEKDIDSAEKSIMAAESFITYKDPAPSYSKAFLKFYRRQFEWGWNHLKAALRPERIIDADIIMGIVKFYEDVLDIEPDNKQLYFPLAVIYYEDLGDETLAKKYFKKFIKTYDENCDNKEIKILLDETKKYLEKL